MAEAFTYVTLLSIFIIIPTIITVLANLKIILTYKLVVISSLAILPFTFLWDYFATIDRVWYFVNIMNIWVLGLPIEEILFMTFLAIFVSSVTLITLKQKR